MLHLSNTLQGFLYTETCYTHDMYEGAVDRVYLKEVHYLYTCRRASVHFTNLEPNALESKREVRS